MENILEDWIKKSKKHAELIGSGKTNEEALREVWGDEEAEQVLALLDKIETKTMENPLIN